MPVKYKMENVEAAEAAKKALLGQGCDTVLLVLIVATATSVQGG